MIKLIVVEAPQEISESSFIREYLEKGWTAYEQSSIDAFISDMNYMVSDGQATDDDIEKAKKDISKLVPKVIVDSIGRRKTVYVKPMETSKDGSETSQAIEKYRHSVTKQKMSRRAALSHIERHYGKDVADEVRAWAEERRASRKSGSKTSGSKTSGSKTSGGKREKRRSFIPSSDGEPPADFLDALADGEDVEFMTADRRKISVHPNAARGVSVFGSSGRTQQIDIERMKSVFISYMNEEEGVPSKTAARVFHEWLSGGHTEFSLSTGKDGGYKKYSMRSVIKEIQPEARKDTAYNPSPDEIDKSGVVKVGDTAMIKHSSGKNVKVKVLGIKPNGEAWIKPLTFDVVPKSAMLIVNKKRLIALK